MLSMEKANKLSFIEFLIFLFFFPQRSHLQTKPERIKHAIRNADATKGQRRTTVTVIARHHAAGQTRAVQILRSE